MEEAFVEVAKNNFVLAVFVLMMVIIGMLLYFLIMGKFKEGSSRMDAIESDVRGIRENMHKIGNNMNATMSTVQNEMKELNKNVQFLAIKMGKDPMDFINEN